jgi:ATP-dependent Clp protease ATP-binding subunit ClpA
VLELTFREALRMGHNYTGTEHILLALAEFENGTGVLADLGIDKAAAEAHITAALAVRGQKQQAGRRSGLPSSLHAGSPDHPNLHPDTHYPPADPSVQIGGTALFRASA